MSRDAPATAAALPPVLETHKLSKAFGRTRACNAVDLSIERGEIHALLGENGAGKSTFVKMLFGSLQPDAGTVFWNGVPVTIRSPGEARALGIAMVFQHFALFEALSVTENIALALRDGASVSDVEAKVRRVSRDYGLPIDPRSVVGDLSVGERQRVEIVRCLLQDPHLLILDEPTSVLTPDEADRLFDVLRRMQGEGRSVLYISHRLDEVQRLCGRATILRHGKVVDACDPRAETARTLALRMVGGEVEDVQRRSVSRAGNDVLSIAHLYLPTSDAFGTSLHDVCLDVAEGELVCIAGVSGNGQGELFAAISGETLTEAGAISIGKVTVGGIGINARRKLGAAFVPEERLGHGAVPTMTLSLNMLLARHASDPVLAGGSVPLVRPRRLREFAARVADAMDVRKGSPDPPAGALSGGNLQKYVVGRELDRNPRLMVVDQPTWGVDAGAAARIRQALVDLAAGGAAVLVISQDLDEIFEIATHVAVIANGRLSRKRPVDAVTRESVGLLMTGADEAEAA